MNIVDRIKATMSEYRVSSLQVMRSAAGWYVGRSCTHTAASEFPRLVEPYSRDSMYYGTKLEAEQALRTGSYQGTRF